MPFTKMHGIGNDYLYLDARTRAVKNPGRLSREMSDRHFGVGSDGLILVMKSKRADFRMRIFNPDGSEAEMCGNGIRCFAKYVYDRRFTKKTVMAIETMAGIMPVRVSVRGGKVSAATVDMGEPVLQRERIPMIGAPGMVIDEPLPLDGVRFNVTSLSMGNPHAVIYVEDVERFPVEKYGPLIERHDLFPNRTNVEFVEVVNDREIIQRTWERGTGETLACGTGASAAVVAGCLSRNAARSVTVRLRGGALRVEWKERDNRVYLTGPAVEVFEGSWPNA
ncbi:MAG TPA: diaminopimelate epimerase [Spirochaetota bacterium]|nr:diaminopimelate epimerase [Spirochaetota bacterium]HNT10110.1 diaminopimelate epimerase [Spirochaetota bacterium]HNV47279.1 diaminopimelate epimerase [Spirochaetota bacterium]HOS39382.1 diaminopimelate epimerase [Spirochaetota bacterium]HPI22745.1 diaminopimelate epimerase [Spirochaetota bacterium]